MWQDLLIALSLVLIIEGMLPFLSPIRWRETLLTVLHMDNRSIRGIGLASMVLGCLCLYFLKH